MGLSSGTVSYLRFVAAPVTEGFEERACEQLASKSFREIDLGSEEEQVEGWVRFDDAFAADFDPTTLVTPSGNVLFRLRTDTLKVPAGTLKAYVDQAAGQRAKVQGREKLSKKELDVLKLEMKKQLRLRSLPKLSLTDVVWNIQTGEVRMISTSKSVAGRFVDLFEKTFEVSLRPVGLLTVLWLRGMSEEDIDGLALVEAERFHLIRD